MKPLICYVTLGALGLLCGCVQEKARPGNSNGAAVVEKAPGLKAVAILYPASQSQARGTVSFYKKSGDEVRVDATFSGLPPGNHAFHIHEKGDCSTPDASSAGGHFNPHHMPHGGPDARQRHVGDFGNLAADSDGNAHYSRVFTNLEFSGEASIIGRGVIVHEKPDDMQTQPSGNAGARIACGVIEAR